MQMSLKAHRVNAGMTQEDVADRLNISRSMVINIENNKVEPKELYIYAFAKLYNVDIDNIRI